MASMTDSKYQCKKCAPNYPCICISCYRAMEERHDAMLEFIKKIACLHFSDNEILAKIDAGYEYHQAWSARKLLKEIGDINE